MALKEELYFRHSKSYNRITSTMGSVSPGSICGSYADVFVKLIFPGWHLEDSLQHDWEDKYPSLTKMTQASRVIHLINFNLSNLLT